MFRASGIALIALGLSGAQAQAADAPAFAAYKSICYATRADPLRALAALGPGWTDAPSPQAPGTQAHKVKTAGATRWELLLIEQVLPKGSDQTPFAKRMRICLLTTSSPSSGLKAAVSALMGAPPNAQPPGGLSWSYFDSASGREYYSTGTAAESNARLAKAPLVIVMAGETPQGGVAGFTEVRAVPE